MIDLLGFISLKRHLEASIFYSNFFVSKEKFNEICINLVKFNYKNPVLAQTESQNRTIIILDEATLFSFIKAAKPLLKVFIYFPRLPIFCIMISAGRRKSSI